MRHIDKQTKKQTKTQARKKFLPLVLVALVGGGRGALWAQTVSTLDTVVVTASRAQERVREVSSNVTIIDAEDIKASTASTVADLLTQEGFFVVTQGDTSVVTIRGMVGCTGMCYYEEESTALILLNGRRIGMNNPNLIALGNVDRVEIIRGPSAVQYGSAALGGVINIITKRGAGLKPFASIEAGIGSDSLKREKLSFGGSVNQFDFAFAGTNFSRDDMTVHNERRYYHTQVHKNQSANLDIGYTFGENHRIGVNYNRGEIKSELGGGIRPYSANTPARSYTDHRKFNENTALSYTGAVNDRSLDWLVNYSFGSNELRQYSSTTGLASYKNFIDNKVFNAQLNYNTDLFTLSGGFDRFQYDTDIPIVATRTIGKDTGFYATGKLRLLQERLIFSLGLRHDKYEGSGNKSVSSKKNHTGGSVGVVYLPVEWLKFRANYAEGFKIASARQLGGDGRGYAPNSSLVPEESKTWEFGADANWNNINASATYFHTNWKDKIQSISGTYPGGLNAQYQNIKRATIAGLEAALSWDIGKAFKQNYNLSPFVNLTYLGTRKNHDRMQYSTYHCGSATDKCSDILQNTPEWMIVYGINYVHPGLKLKTRLNANYYGKVIAADRTRTGNPPFGRPSGTVVNWSLDKELVEFSGQYGGSLSLRGEVNNLFDGKNEMWWTYPGPGRSFYVGLRYDFF